MKDKTVYDDKDAMLASPFGEIDVNDPHKIADLLYYHSLNSDEARLCLSSRDFGSSIDCMMIKDGKDRYYLTDPKIVRRYDGIKLISDTPFGRDDGKEPVRIICLRGKSYEGKTVSVVFSDKIADMIEKKLDEIEQIKRCECGRSLRSLKTK